MITLATKTKHTTSNCKKCNLIDLIHDGKCISSITFGYSCLWKSIQTKYTCMKDNANVTLCDHHTQLEIWEQVLQIFKLASKANY